MLFQTSQINAKKKKKSFSVLVFRFATDLFKCCFQLTSNFRAVMEKLNQL